MSLLPRYVFGDKKCRARKEFQFDMFIDVKVEPKEFVVIKPFYFNQAGYYRFTLIATNLLFKIGMVNGVSYLWEHHFTYSKSKSWWLFL